MLDLDGLVAQSRRAVPEFLGSCRPNHLKVTTLEKVVLQFSKQEKKIFSSIIIQWPLNWTADMKTALKKSCLLRHGLLCISFGCLVNIDTLKLIFGALEHLLLENIQIVEKKLQVKFHSILLQKFLKVGQYYLHIWSSPGKEIIKGLQPNMNSGLFDWWLWSTAAHGDGFKKRLGD